MLLDDQPSAVCVPEPLRPSGGQPDASDPPVQRQELNTLHAAIKHGRAVLLLLRRRVTIRNVKQ